MTLAALLLLALVSGTRTSTLVDDVYSIGAGRSRYVDITMPVEPVRVLCAFEVESPAEAAIRARLVAADGAVIADSGITAHGGISVRPSRKGRYRLVLDNSMNPGSPARVALRVRLVYGEGPMQPARRADPVKGHILVWSSMAIFACAALFAGTRIKRNLDRRR
jgi:hypothetical protein